MSLPSTQNLYLSYDGLTDPLGQSQILPYIIGLEDQGFEFTIISFEKAEAFREARNKIEARILGKKIKWIPLRYHKTPPVLSTVLDIWLLWRCVTREHRKTPFNLIHCRSYITSLVGLRMKRKKGIRFVFDMRGFWADERVEGGLWNLKNPVFKIIYNYFKKKEKEFLKEADHIVSLTESAKTEMLSWKIEIAPITVIPTCVDLELFNQNLLKKEDKAKLREQLGILPEDFVLLYLGSWGTWYLTEEMLAFFTELRKQRKNSKFLIVSTDKINLENYPDRRDVILAHSPRQLVPLYISLANASVVFIKTSFSKKASSATKIGEIIAMNIPVITNKGWGDIERIMNNGVSGIFVEEFTPTAFGETIKALHSLLAKEIPSADLHKYLSLKSGIYAYAHLLRRVLEYGNN